MKLLNIDVDPDARLPTYNKALAARSPTIMFILKKIKQTQIYIAGSFHRVCKKISKLVEMLLFTKSKKLMLIRIFL